MIISRPPRHVKLVTWPRNAKVKTKKIGKPRERKSWNSTSKRRENLHRLQTDHSMQTHSCLCLSSNQRSTFYAAPVVSLTNVIWREPSLFICGFSQLPAETYRSNTGLSSIPFLNKNWLNLNWGNYRPKTWASVKPMVFTNNLGTIGIKVYVLIKENMQGFQSKTPVIYQLK